MQIKQKKDGNRNLGHTLIHVCIFNTARTVLLLEFLIWNKHDINSQLNIDSTSLIKIK